MDLTGVCEKDRSTVLQSFISSENSAAKKNTQLGRPLHINHPQSNSIDHMYNGPMNPYEPDGSQLRPSTTVDLATLQWQNMGRDEYSVGDTLLWDGTTVQVDQLANFHSLQVLESTPDGELKKTELFDNIPGTAPATYQDPALCLESQSSLTVPTSDANIACIPSSMTLSTETISTIPLSLEGSNSVPTPAQKTPRARMKKSALRTSPKPGGKKAKMLKIMPQGKGLSAKTEKATFSSKIAGTVLQDPSSCSAMKRKVSQDHLNPTTLEDNASQVQDRFNLGCECQDSNCFDALCADSVFRHRLNIAELTKAEHDMYLMGVTMACLGNPEHTNRNKERQRLRAKYVYQGRHVCLQAFLYLENCTLYQVKRIRKHVMTNGVVPRIHGNHGKKPHNRFPLELYCHVTDFLKSFLRHYNVDRDVSKTTPLFLGPDVTRKSVHQAYLNFCETHKPTDGKVMGYSTFRHFMKDQFPYIRFRQLDVPGIGRELNKQHLKPLEGKTSSNLSPHRIAALQKKSPSSVRTPTLIRKDDVQNIVNSAGRKCMQPQDVSEEVDVESSPFDSPSDHSCSAESGNVILLNSVPLITGSNYVVITSDSAYSKDGSGSSNKTMTVNPGSLRLLSGNGVVTNSLVPMNTVAMLSPGVFPIYLDSEVQTDQVTVAEKRKTEVIIKSSGN